MKPRTRLLLVDGDGRNRVVLPTATGGLYPHPALYPHAGLYPSHGASAAAAPGTRLLAVTTSRTRLLDTAGTGKTRLLEAA